MSILKRNRIAVIAALACALLAGGTQPAAAQSTPEPEDADERLERLVQMGMVALAEGRTDQAEVALNRVLRVRPAHRQARIGLGTLYVSTQRYREGAELMEQLREDYPQEYTVLNNLAWLYATTTDLSIRNGQRAIALAQEAMLLQTDDHHVWSTLSAAHYIVGNYDRALRAAEEAVRLGERTQMNPEALQNYRQQVQRCRQAADALSILD